MTLTDEEKAEARATDPRAAAIIDRCDAMPPERSSGCTARLPRRRDAAAGSRRAGDRRTPWWDPGADAAVSPETDAVAGRRRRGRARAAGCGCARAGRADAQDMFLAGRIAVVPAVLSRRRRRHALAVTLDDDPAADLHDWYGRFLTSRPTRSSRVP